MQREKKGKSFELANYQGSQLTTFCVLANYILNYETKPVTLNSLARCRHYQESAVPFSLYYFEKLIA